MSDLSATQQDVIVGELALLDGRRQTHMAHLTLLTPPRRAHADRCQEAILIFIDLGGGGADGLARVMVEAFEGAYWRCAGPVTTAVREGINAANDHLRQENRLMPVSHRRRAGLVCGVLRDDDVYLAQVGPAKALLTQDAQVLQFPRSYGDRLPMGVSSGLDIQYSHALLRPGDRLLLTGESWAQHMQEEALADALWAGESGVDQVMLFLERAAGKNPFSALVLECPAPAIAPQDEDDVPLRQSEPFVQEALPPVEAVLDESPPPPESQGRSEFEASSHIPAGMAYAEQARESRRPRLPGRPFVGLGFGTDRLKQSRRSLARMGWSLADAGRALVMRVLPEPEPAVERHRVRRRKNGIENVSVMAGIAVAIPLLVAFMVATIYLRNYESDERDLYFSRARDAAAAARQADAVQAAARWETALQTAQEALDVAPNEGEMLALQAEALRALDRINSAVRPDLIRLWDYGREGGMRVSASRLQVYVLDSVEDQVTRLMLDQSLQRVISEDVKRVAYQGQVVGEAQVGAPRDILWLAAGDAWTDDALLILTDDNQLLQHDPSWGLGWLSFDTTVSENQVEILRPYSGKLYNLVPEQGQLWRFHYDGEGFVEGEGYFSAPGPDLTGTVDMAIDGAVYILKADGEILKFFGGESQPFQVSDLPQPFERPVALVSEGDATSGALYVADAEAGSIVALDKSGAFLYQIRADGDALKGVASLALEPDSRTLYATVDGYLYAVALAALPQPEGASD